MQIVYKLFLGLSGGSFGDIARDAQRRTMNLRSKGEPMVSRERICRLINSDREGDSFLPCVQFLVRLFQSTPLTPNSSPLTGFQEAFSVDGGYAAGAGCGHGLAVY